jgi:hypothetical protein
MEATAEDGDFVKRHLREDAEPGLDPAVAAESRGVEAYVHLPNFLIVSAAAPR